MSSWIRDGGTISGMGPANSTLRVVYNGGSDAADVITNTDGRFSYNAGWMWGNYSVNTNYRSFRVRYYRLPLYPSIYHLSGHRQPVRLCAASTAGVWQAAGARWHFEGDSYAVAQYDGWYYLGFYSIGINTGDTVVVDAGSLHFEQLVVPLTITGDTTTDVVSGMAPPNGWLNVFARRSFGPYYNYLYHYFRASGTGAYSTNFNGAADMRGGYSLEVIYWEGGNRDRVSVSRYIPYVGINQTQDYVFGYSTPGISGTVAVRTAGGTLKADGSVTPSPSSGYFSFGPPGLDLVPGDQVEVRREN